MGIYDDVANIKAIKEAANVDKVFYIGYSQGTIQMFYGLSHLEKEFHANNVHKVVQLAPCFVPYIDTTVDIMNSTIMTYHDLGIYAFNGPNWERDLQTLCDNMPEDICAYAKSLDGYMGQSVESEIHWNMNATQGRFQEKQDDQKWLAGEM